MDMEVGVMSVNAFVKLLKPEWYLEKLLNKDQDENGHEMPDPVPVAPPLGFVKQPSLTEQIRSMVRSEALRREAEEAGAETFEEADDFVVDDDPELRSPYEIFEQPGPAIPPANAEAPKPVEAAPEDKPAEPVVPAASPEKPA